MWVLLESGGFWTTLELGQADSRTGSGRSLPHPAGGSRRDSGPRPRSGHSAQRREDGHSAVCRRPGSLQWPLGRLRRQLFEAAASVAQSAILYAAGARSRAGKILLRFWLQAATTTALLWLPKSWELLGVVRLELRVWGLGVNPIKPNLIGLVFVISLYSISPLKRVFRVCDSDSFIREYPKIGDPNIVP